MVFENPPVEGTVNSMEQKTGAQVFDFDLAIFTAIVHICLGRRLGDQV
jgi:hypothetical protein